jgi:molybdate transport system substrate-binding protein
VLVLAAASTQDALREIADRFTKETGIEVVLNADDSGRLANQIVNGAPADLFLSANEKWADFVREKGFAQEVKPLLGNTLVLVVPRGNPGHVAEAKDLRLPGVRRVALAGPTVPAGIYARQALKKLNLLEEIESRGKVVPGENVRVTLAYVENGEVEAGIVYATDARITDRVEVVATFDPSTHDPIVYPLVLLTRAEGKDGARRLRDFLQGPAAADVFRRAGFTIAGGK